jgi:hypothetical protein
MNRKVLSALPLAWLFLFSFLIARPLGAQVSGATLSGNITDAQGGAVVSAKVSVRNVATDVTTDTVTNAAGAYTALNLNPGDYDVSVTALGFSTTKTKVTLTVGQKQELNLALTVGQVSQEIEVTGAAPQVDLESSTVSGEVSAQTVRELPLNGRDWTTLATLEPGVSAVESQLNPAGSGKAAGRGLGSQMAVGGGRPTQNSYRLDGIIVNDYSNAGPGSVLGQNLGVDAIQEFTVLTSDYSAEYGFTSGGVINAVTRSGTNTFHGTAFEFLRNDKFDANTFFSNASSLPKTELRRNQFGAAGGWRILKDKLFLFGNYEGLRYVQGQPSTSNTTLTPAVKSGTVVNLFTGVPTTVTVDPNIQKFLGFWPAPSPGYNVPGGIGCLPLNKGTYNVGGCNPNVGKYIWQGNNVAHENFYTARGDYKISDKDSLFSTYLHDYSQLVLPQALQNVPQEYDSWRQGIIIEETHVFSAAWANSFRAGLDRTSDYGGHSNTCTNPLNCDPTLGMQPGFNSPNIVLTGTGVTSATAGVPWAGSIQDYHGQIFELFDDAFSTHGNHGLKFGFEFLADQTDTFHPGTAGSEVGNGTFSAAGIAVGTCVTLPCTITNPHQATAAEAPCFNSTPKVPLDPTNGNNYDPSCGGLVNFLTNNPLSAFEPANLNFLPNHHMRDKVFGGYIQDDWRFRPSLTLNLGLRYEMSTIPTENRGLVANMTSITQTIPASIPNAAAAYAAGLSNVFFTKNPTLTNFEPRIGFAWDPFHNGKTSVRGGFGVFDVLPLPYEMILNNGQTAPWTSLRTVIGPVNGIPSPNVLAGAPDQFPFNIVALSSNPAVPSPALSSSRIWNFVERAPSRDYVYQYNFNIQRQITPNTTILVGYMGSRGFHNPFQGDSSNTILPSFAANGDVYWPGCFGAASGTTAGQKLCVTNGTTFTGNLSPSAQQSLLLNPSAGATASSGNLSTWWQSSSWYNALTVKVSKAMSHGFQVEGSFTWSKSIDDSSGSGASDNYLFSLQNPPWYDLSLVKGLSDFNVGKTLVINGLWEVPTTKALGSFGERALGGWQLGVITKLNDGIPIYPAISNASVDMVGEDIPTIQPPNVAPGCSPQNLTAPNYRNTLVYANINCVSLVPLTAANAAYCDQRLFATAPNTCSNIRGNLGRNTMIGPGLFNVDFSVFKNNYIRRISEDFNIQFRAEFFNVLNYTNFAPPSLANLVPFDVNGNPQTSTYGVLQSTQTPNREIQFAMKVIW